MPISKIYDDSNYKSLLGQHDEKIAGDITVPVHVTPDGVKRYLSRIPTDSGRKLMAAAPKFRDNFPVYSREQLKALWKDRKDRRRRVSDFQNFDPHDQNGYPSCWRNGSAHAVTTTRVVMGQPLVYISSMSLCPEHSPNTGGDEMDSAQYLVDHGGADFSVWGNNDSNMRLTNDPKVQESRKHHRAYQLYVFDGNQEQRQLQYATACLLDPPMCCVVAYNWWSHVISGGDIDYSGSTMLNTLRNNWGPWGDKNDLGFMGYITMAEGHGTPDSGCAFGPVQLSTL